jgi:hypothetical protein
MYKKKVTVSMKPKKVVKATKKMVKVAPKAKKVVKVTKKK